MVLGDTPSLVILDDCEHVIATCADLVDTLLNANPNVTVLATSREALSVPGEVVWRVLSLPSPVLSLRDGEPIGHRCQRTRHRRGAPASADAPRVGRSAESRTPGCVGVGRKHTEHRALRCPAPTKLFQLLLA